MARPTRIESQTLESLETVLAHLARLDIDIRLNQLRARQAIRRDRRMEDLLRPAVEMANDSLARVRRCQSEIKNVLALRKIAH